MNMHQWPTVTAAVIVAVMLLFLFLLPPSSQRESERGHGLGRVLMETRRGEVECIVHRRGGVSCDWGSLP